MDSIQTDKLQDDGDCRSEMANKRKRRYSSTQTSDNESPKKKTLATATTTTETSVHLDAVASKQQLEENHENTTIQTKTNVDEAPEQLAAQVEVAKEHEEDEQDFESQFLLEELCDEVLYEIFKFLDTWTLMSLMK